MTNKELQSVDALAKVVTDFIKASREVDQKREERLAAIENKLDKKFAPVHLESDILQVAQESIAAAIQSSLSGYGSPLGKLVLSVVDEQSSFLRQIISESFNQVIRTEDFRKSIVSAFSHKVSRSIISNNDGLFDKVGQDLKQDPVFRSRMTLAVAAVVEECLKDRQVKNAP